MKQPKVYFRDAQPEDVSFIFNSWLKSYRNAKAVSHVPSSIYYTEHHKVLEKILKTCNVTIASNPMDKSQIYGYVVFEKIDGFNVFHYAYTKHPFRKMGIMNALVRTVHRDPSVGCLYTHDTAIGSRIAPKYNGVYHPYLALTPDYRSLDVDEIIEEIEQEYSDVEGSSESDRSVESEKTAQESEQE